MAKRIVILGGGFAGAYCAKAIEWYLKDELATGKVELLVIDKHNYFVFFPLLVEAGTGTLQPSHAVVSIRSFLKRGKFLMASVIGVDPASRTVTVDSESDDTNDTRTIQYDHLVIALGSVTRWPDIPGLKQHALGIKTVAEAVSLRDRAVCLLERADSESDETLRRKLLHWVIVGGGYTGVEVAGEFQEYMEKAARRYPGINHGEVKVTLVDRGERILNTLHPSLSEYAAKHLRKRAVDLYQKDSVAEVGPDFVKLASGKVLEAHTCIMAAGIAPPPCFDHCGFDRDKGGWLLCETDGRLKGRSTEWGIGDCAVNPDGRGGAYPPTAQHAIREGRQTAANLARVIRGKPTKPIRIFTQGWLAAFGKYDAVAMVFGIRIASFLAWFMWRTVYLMKMPGIRRSCRVVMDWTADLLFDKDYVELGVHRVMQAAKKREDRPL